MEDGVCQEGMPLGVDVGHVVGVGTHHSGLVFPANSSSSFKCIWMMMIVLFAKCVSKRATQLVSVGINLIKIMFLILSWLLQPRPTHRPMRTTSTQIGATDHITGELEKLTLRNKYNGGDHIHTANGAGLNISHIGHTTVCTPNCDIHLKNVLYVP